jgi:uncharacterized protein involved in tellurium resistance
MCRSLITKWDDLAGVHCDGDRLSIFVRDKRTGKLKCIDATIYSVDYEGEPGWDETVREWEGQNVEGVSNE